MSNDRRKFRSQTSDNMDRWKAEQGRGREKRKIRRKKSKKKEDADAWKGRKVAKHCVFPMIWGSGGSKSRLAKAAGAEPAGQMRDEKLHAVVARSTFPSQNVQNTPGADHFWQLRCRKSARRCGAKHISKWKCTKHTMCGPLLEVEMSKKCTTLWREANFQVKMHTTHHVRTTLGSWDVQKVHAVVTRSTFRSQNVKSTHHSRTTFGSWDVEKVHAVVARSTFRSQNVKSTRGSDHAVVARSTFPSQNVQNTGGSDHFWRLRCRKSARPCGAKHISKFKMYKTLGVRTTFGSWDVEKVHAVVARSTFRSRNVQNTRGSDHFWRFRCRFASLHYTTLHYTTLHYTTLQDITLHYTPVHYITLHYTPVNSTTLNYTTPHYITLHYAPLHYTTLHHITLHYTTLHYTTWHYTTLSSTTLHYLTLHYTPLHYNYNYNYTTRLHYTPLH